MKKQIDIFAYWESQGIKPYKKQIDLITHKFPKELFVPKQTFKKACLSISFGTGKTTTVLMDFALWVLSSNCSWTPKYGDTRPKSLVTAPESRSLRKHVDTLCRLIPPECRDQPRTNQDRVLVLRLRNGHEIQFISAKSNIDTTDFQNLVIDEISHPVYTSYNLEKILKRCRDNTEQGRYKRIYYAGIASFNVKQLLDTGEPNMYISLPGLLDNPNSKDDPEYLKLNIEDMPKVYEDAVMFGGWAPDLFQSAFEGSYDPIESFTPDFQIDPSQDTAMSFDPGKQGGVVLIQRYKDSVVVVDEYFGINAQYGLRGDREEFLRHIRNHFGQYNIKSIDVDTDEGDALRGYCRSIFKLEPHYLMYNDDGHKREVKLQRMLWALKALDGKRRLLFHPRLKDKLYKDYSLLNQIAWAQVRKDKPDELCRKGSKNKEHILEALMQWVVRYWPSKNQRSNSPVTVDVDF